jgi:hypothetical protein
LGSIVVLHSAARAYLLPEALSRLMRDEFVHKVCIDSLEIAELLKRAKLRIASLVDAHSMAAYHEEELVMSDLDGEIYTIDERDRPYSNPALFKGPVQWYALQRLRGITHLVWRLSRQAQGRKASGANVLQWSRGVLCQFTTPGGSQRNYPGNTLEEVAKLLKADVYVCPQSGWTTRFEVPQEDHQWLEVAKRAVEEDYLTEPDLRKLPERCQKCGREESHSSGPCAYALREVTCCYPLCEEEGHSIVVCPLLAERCPICGTRGHRQEHHDSVEGATMTQQMLEQTFLVYSKMHSMCGGVWYAKVTYHGHWRAFLYGEDPYDNPKLLVATGLKAGISRRELKAQSRRELDLEEIRREAPTMDPVTRAMRINAVLAKYTASALQTEMYRAQLEAYGVSHLAQLPLPSLDVNRGPVTPRSEEVSPQLAADARVTPDAGVGPTGAPLPHDNLVNRMDRLIHGEDSDNEGDPNTSAMEVSH